jgi:hypothetical protein
LSFPSTRALKPCVAELQAGDATHDDDIPKVEMGSLNFAIFIFFGGICS